MGNHIKWEMHKVEDPSERNPIIASWHQGRKRAWQKAWTLKELKPKEMALILNSDFDHALCTNYVHFVRLPIALLDVNFSLWSYCKTVYITLLLSGPPVYKLSNLVGFQSKTLIPHNPSKLEYLMGCIRYSNGLGVAFTVLDWLY